MSTKAKRHTHKYHRMEIGSSKLWKCAFPDCPHVMPKHLTDTIIGKYSVCWTCDNDKMILNSENMADDMPTCDNCKLGIEPVKPIVQFDFANLESILGKK